MTGITAIMAGGLGNSVFVSSSSVSGSDGGFSASGLVTTSGSPNTDATGGIAPYTYSWAYVSGTVGFNINSSTARYPSWSDTILAGTVEAVWRVTVTDAASNTGTADITVSLTWANFS